MAIDTGIFVKIHGEMTPPNPVFDRLRFFYDFKTIYDFDVVPRHIRGRIRHECFPQRGTYKKNMGRVDFNKILAFINKSWNLDKPFTPWEFTGICLATEGTTNGIRTRLELQANYIMVYQLM